VTRYVALQPIDAGNVRAYNPGDPVHADNVEAQGYVVGEQVADAESEQAVAVLRKLGILPAEDADEAEAVEPVEQVSAGRFDPSQHTIADVNEHLDRYPDDTARVLAAEAAGKSRAGILHGPHGAAPDVAEA
jgi:hypothetical protein